LEYSLALKNLHREACIMVQAGSKAGLVGGVIAVVLILVNLIPCLGWAICCLGSLILMVGVGALAVNFGGADIATSTEGAGAGAIAGAITAFIGGLANLLVNLVATVFLQGTGLMARALAQIPPGVRRQLWEMGVDLRLLARQGTGIMGTVVGGSLSCVLWIVVAACLGALGGILYKALKTS